MVKSHSNVHCEVKSAVPNACFVRQYYIGWVPEDGLARMPIASLSANSHFQNRKRPAVKSRASGALTLIDPVVEKCLFRVNSQGRVPEMVAIVAPPDNFPVTRLTPPLLSLLFSSG